MNWFSNVIGGSRSNHLITQTPLSFSNPCPACLGVELCLSSRIWVGINGHIFSQLTWYVNCDRGVLSSDYALLSFCLPQMYLLVIKQYEFMWNFLSFRFASQYRRRLTAEQRLHPENQNCSPRPPHLHHKTEWLLYANLKAKIRNLVEGFLQKNARRSISFLPPANPGIRLFEFCAVNQTKWPTRPKNRKNPVQWFHFTQTVN